MFKSNFFSLMPSISSSNTTNEQRPMDHYPREIGISCYALTPTDKNQLSLLEEVNKEIWLTEAVDCINNQYGEFTITYANSLSSKEIVKQKYPLGVTKYFELLCKRA